MHQRKILLESGTNEVEFLEFIMGQQSFGLNVLKIQTIEQYDTSKVTTMPESKPCLCGMLLYRNRTIPLVNLRKIFRNHFKQKVDISNNENQQIKQIVLVLEFNNLTCALLVDSVNRIHRVSWSDFTPLHQFFHQFSSEFIGSVNINNNEIFIIDIEKIIAEIIPESKLVFDEQQLPTNQEQLEKRENVNIYFAEDSDITRATVEKIFHDCQYVNVKSFCNGLDAYTAISSLSEQYKPKELDKYINILVSDIEMPQMDGLTLCRNIKAKMPDLPVVIFSSLINDQIATKCKAVNADNYVSKSKVNELINIIDHLCLNTPNISTAL